MATPTVNFFCWAAITLADKSDGSTSTITVTNRPVMDATGLAADHFPILAGFGNLGASMGLYIPQTTSGTLVIDVSPESFGHSRRLLDLFERNTPINQDITIKTAFLQVGAFPDLSSDGTTQFTGKVKSWAVRDGVLSLSCDGQAISRRIGPLMITEVDFPSAPAQSIGKSLPIVIGESRQVYTNLIATDSSPTFAYATTLGTEHPVSGVQVYKAKTSGGEYRAAFNPASASTAVVSYSGADSTVYTALNSWEEAYKLDYLDGTDNYILTSGRLRAIGNSSGGASGHFHLRIYTENPSGGGPSDNLVGAAIIDLSNYTTEYSGSADFWLDFHFDEPIHLTAGGYFYSIQVTNNTATAFRDLRETVDTPEIWARAADAWSGNTTTARALKAEFFAVRFVDSTSSAANSQGLGYASFECTQQSAGAGQTATDLTGLEFIVEIDGLKDDSSGSIGAGANTLIEQPHHAVRLLTQTWSGSAWSSPQVGVSDFSSKLSAAYPSKFEVDGATIGRETIESIITGICRGTGARVAQRRTGLQMYAETSQQTSQATLTDEDCELIDYFEAAANETVLNVIELFYDRRIETARIETGAADGTLKDYAKSLFWDASNNSDVEAAIGQSETIYGRRPLGEVTFDWIRETATAQNLARLLVSRYAWPHQYVTLRTTVRDHLTLDVLDVVEIVHAGLPAYFGTSTDAKPMTYDGTAVTTEGYYEKRAKLYRGQIERRKLNYSRGGELSLELVIRLITNEAEVL